MCSICKFGPPYIDLDQKYCKECFTKMNMCRFCHRIRNCVSIDYVWVCKDCTDHTFQCSCGTTVLQYNTCTADGTRTCSRCFEENYFYCDNCGDATLREDSDDYLCNNCSNKKKPITIVGLETEEFYYRYGIELECIYLDDEEQVDRTGWIDTEDGSIKPSGIEYNSPIFQNDCTNEINGFCREASEIHGVNKSCGFHLHIESKDFSDEKLGLIYRNAKNLESWLFSIVAESRRENNYCRKLTNIESIKKFDDAWYKTYEHSGRKKNKYDETRYFWLNFHSHYYRGTIEIRLHQGTIDPVKIMNWVKLWQAIFNLDREVNSVEEFLSPQLIEYYSKRAEKLNKTLVESF